MKLTFWNTAKICFETLILLELFLINPINSYQRLIWVKTLVIQQHVCNNDWFSEIFIFESKAGKIKFLW